MKWPFIVLTMRATYCTKVKHFLSLPRPGTSVRGPFAWSLEEHILGVRSIYSRLCSCGLLVWWVCVCETQFYLRNKMPSDLYRITEREDCQPKAIIMLMKPMAGEKFLANVNHEEKCQEKPVTSPYRRNLRWNLHLKQLAKGRFLYNNVLFKPDPLWAYRVSQKVQLRSLLISKLQILD